MNVELVDSFCVVTYDKSFWERVCTLTEKKRLDIFLSLDFFRISFRHEGFLLRFFGFVTTW